MINKSDFEGMRIYYQRKIRAKLCGTTVQVVYLPKINKYQGLIIVRIPIIVLEPPFNKKITYRKENIADYDSVWLDTDYYRYHIERRRFDTLEEMKKWVKQERKRMVDEMLIGVNRNIRE